MCFCNNRAHRLQTEMDATSTTAVMSTSNVTSMTTTATPEEVYDPLWVITIRWIIGAIIVFVGKKTCKN